MRFAPIFFIGVTGGLLTAVLAGVPATSQPAPQVQSRPPLVLAGGTIIDLSNWGASARDLRDAIVILRGGVISNVGPRANVPIPKDAQVIDCTGKYLIPGLVDGFAGMSSQGQANADLYMGVTTVVARSDQFRGAIDFAAHPKPHLYLIDSVGTADNWSLLTNRPEWADKLKEGAQPVELNPQDTAQQLIATARLGTRVIWLGPDITAANTQWIIARAHQMGLVAYGEFVSTPYRVAVEAGVDALFNMGRYDLGVIPDELQQPLVTTPQGASANTAYDYASRLPPTDPHLRNYAQFLATHHAALMPAFSLYYARLPGHRNLWKDPAAALLDPAQMYHPSDPDTGEMNYALPGWARHLPSIAQRWVEQNLRKKANQEALRLWRINQTIYSAGPHYLAASGADAMGSMPGISMHTELEMLVRLGLSPREALAAATNNYALQLGWNELGLISPGRRADILVVDGDPTENIWNARRISTLILDGNVIDRNALLSVKK